MLLTSPPIFAKTNPLTKKETNSWKELKRKKNLNDALIKTSHCNLSPTTQLPAPFPAHKKSLKNLVLFVNISADPPTNAKPVCSIELENRDHRYRPGKPEQKPAKGETDGRTGRTWAGREWGEVGENSPSRPLAVTSAPSSIDRCSLAFGYLQDFPLSLLKSSSTQ